MIDHLKGNLKKKKAEMELEKVIKVGYGFEGMLETSQWPDNTFVTYPPTKF